MLSAFDRKMQTAVDEDKSRDDGSIPKGGRHQGGGELYQARNQQLVAILFILSDSEMVAFYWKFSIKYYHYIQ